MCGKQRTFRFGEVVEALEANNDRRVRWNFFYKDEHAQVPDYVQVAQGGCAFDPDLMGNRVPFPPTAGELLYHLGWDYNSGDITKHGLRPGRHMGGWTSREPRLGL